jgi:hypothetical protein
VHATRRRDGTGLLVRRDSGTVRTIFVRGDVELSVLVCQCFGRTDEIRERAVDGWARDIDAVLQEPAPERTPA